MDYNLSNDLVIKGAAEEQKRLIKSHMSFLNPKYQDAQQFGRTTYGIKKTIRLYEESKDTLVLPRGSLYKIIGLVGPPDRFENNTKLFDRVDIPSKIELRALQKPWVNGLLRHTQGIGVAPAGSGKTVMALEALARLGQPSLWLTHRQTLVEQFKERAGFFIDAGTIGTIGDGKFEIGDIATAGMIQTLIKKDLTDLRYRFGAVFIDECHIIPAMTTLKVVRQFAPRYLYGVTATPFREDRLEQIMFDTVGMCIANMDRQEVVDAEDIMPAKVIVRRTGIGQPPYMDNTYHKLIDFLAGNQARNTMVLIDILSEVALGNLCIVLTNRVAHGQLLQESLKLLGTDSVHLHASTTTKRRKEGFDRFKSGKVAVIIATYSFLAEGFDHKPTNRIFFTLPHKAKGLIEQAKGRIERSCDGKEDAVLYDYVDSIPVFGRQFESRLDQYEEHNLEVYYP